MSTSQQPQQQPGDDELVFFATSDLAARTKGRAMRAADFDDDTTLGWVPANLGIGPLGHIVEGIPYGSSGDLRLKPDLSSRTRIEGVAGRPAFDLIFADIVETDGRPWESCPRTFLKDAVAELERDFGITVTSAFEHEFVELSATSDPHPFSLQDFRNAEPVGSQLVDVLHRAGVEPENWLPEYAPHQFEITVKPSDPLTAADRAVLVRDIVRDVYDANGRSVSFAPTTSPGSGGNGVHVHFGLYGPNGESLVFDASRDGRVSELAGRFAAGIIAHAPAMTALFAPLVTSYDRLAPHNWSTASAFLGLQNREALVRVCPTNEVDGRDPERQLHFEFRGGDIGANPWLMLGMILRAGIAGLRGELEPAPVIHGEVDLEGEHRDLTCLPKSLPEAIETLLADETVRGWFSPNLIDTFVAVKRDELEHVEPLSPAERCEVYNRVF